MSFKQAEFWDAAQRPRNISTEAVAQMEKVVERYPYFQLLHTLIAKAKHDQQTPDAYPALGRAAIYAPDRRLLRRIFYDELTVVLPNQPSPNVVETATIAEPTTPSIDAIEPIATEEVPESVSEVEETVPEESVSQQTDDDSDSLRDELAKTLEDLRARKEQGTASYAAGEDQPKPEDTPGTDVPRTDVPGTDVPGTDVPGTDVPRTRQQEIIDRFMAANPQITRDATPTGENASDLSASSSAFQDDVATENLAEIMLKQGKTDKAVNLYEKLMLKYPEKKAYFAQKIEQLKNN